MKCKICPECGGDGIMNYYTQKENRQYNQCRECGGTGRVIIRSLTKILSRCGRR